MKETIEIIAKVCHEANKSFCEAYGDYSQKPWNEAEEWQRRATVKGVEFRLTNPQAGQSMQHEVWMNELAANGWKYGEVKDAEKKTHPCFVPYEQLSKFEQKKDALFQGVIDALKD